MSFFRWFSTEQHGESSLSGGRRSDKTERTILDLLPGDIFRVDSEALNRAASFGLLPMEEGWIAGGYVAQLALRRMHVEGRDGDARTDEAGGYHGSCDPNDRAAQLEAVDREFSAAALLRIRTDLVKRGLIT